MTLSETETPCVGVCSTIYGDLICRGCFRHYQDVIDWNTFDATQKTTLLNALDALVTGVLAESIEIIDPALLQAKCAQYHIKIRLSWNPYTWIHALLRAGADKMNTPEKYGFRLKATHAGTPLPALLAHIDERIFANASSHLKNTEGCGKMKENE
jgi:predicted Fe-S protein YdhL (DUF1289 family)